MISVRKALVVAGLLAVAGVAEAGVRLDPESPRRGDLLIVYFDHALDGIERVPAELFDHRFEFVRVEAGRFRAAVAVPLELEPKTYSMRIVLPAETLEHPVTVAPREWNRSELTVAKKFTEQPTGQLAVRIAKETAEWDALFLERPTSWKHMGELVRPVDGEVTAIFGTRRIFNKTLESRHLGLDLGGVTGTPIVALAGGQVVMSSMRFKTGGTLVVDHGGGLFSAYFHMSRRDVDLRDRVEAGELLGLVGKSGRVTGPHLHLSVMVRMESVEDGVLKTVGPFVDPEAILGMSLGSDG